ncbi:PKD-like family lipoprotein [Chitinophaga sp. HK235]|uniref:PKD-like family lipoprotein n=1 Tax=Chitinophaga sp. HK235 TaxID=2952571 RepID=UPI001BA74A4B|nr:PKD-like family lipoprotein [Chitinophaga sp. HK235]
MKTNYIKLLLGGCIICLFNTACYKDQGNYQYHEINNVDSITGIDKEYAILFKDTLRISPKLFATQDQGDTGRYTYRWEALVDGGSRVPGDESNVLIGSFRDLAYPVKLRPAGYDCYYRVKDKQTGVEWFHRFHFTVQSTVYQGWVALCDVKGAVRIDMVSRLGEQDRLIRDVMTFTNAGLPARQGAKQLVFEYSNAGRQFYLNTGNGLERFEGENFTWKSTYGIRYEMLAPVDAGFSVDLFYNSPLYLGVDYLIAGKQVFYRNQVMGGKAFGSPVNYVDDEKTPFNPARFVAGGYGSTSQHLLYDRDKRRFVVHDAMFGTKCSSLQDGKLFSYTTGKDLVYMVPTSYGGGDVFAIMKDDAGKYYTYCINVTRGGVKQSYYTEMTDAPELDKATVFAVSNQLGYVFYAVGGRLYEYDIFIHKATLMADFGTEKISVMKAPFFSSYGKEFYTNLTNSLVVGSYDAARPDTENGVIRVYSIPDRNDALKLTWSYQGLGKIVDLVYRER